MKKNTKTPYKIILELLEYLGGQHGIARFLNIKQPSINRWVRERKIPIARAIQLEKLTNKKFLAKNMRPDIFKA